MEQSTNRSSIINELSKSVHGKLTDYNRMVDRAVTSDPEFLAHLIAWDFTNGQIKDSKIAFPILTNSNKAFPDELIENSLAHLAMQPPRELLKALKFSIQVGTPARRQKKLEKVIHAYLNNKEKEPGKWNRLAARHRRSLKGLYALTHAPIPYWASNILFSNHYIPDSIFADIANLSKMTPEQAAGAISKWHLSPLIVSGAMAGSKGHQDSSVVVNATMEQMSDTEVITRAKSLEKRGLSRDVGLKETFRKKVSKATKSTKATLKTGIAAEEVEDEGLKTMLKELQERQIQAQKDSGRGIDGNWLVIADRSQSQEVAIKLSVHVAAAISKFVTGKVYLVFCNSDATPMDVTGKTLDQIMGQAKFVYAEGNTSYGIGLEWAIGKKLDLDGVVIVGDGGENTSPFFTQFHTVYGQMFGKNLPVYLYQTHCEPKYMFQAGNFKKFMGGAGKSFITHDLTHGNVDYYSIPNLVQTMNVSKFRVVEKIMACPLVTLEQVLPNWQGKATHA